MLNKCSDKAWFVVELCESIKALKVEIANFELYSSVPHQFRVTLGNTYPPRDKDFWPMFGEFSAADDRNVQTFTSESGVFGKYARVEILSHHGNEHYCPISLFRVYGISEIEMIGADDEDDDTHHLDGLPSGPLVGEGQIEGLANEEENKKAKGGIVSFIKEKVESTIDRIVGVFRPKDQITSVDMTAALNETSLVGSTFMYDVSCPECSLDQYRDLYFILASSHKTLIETLNNQNLRSALENGVCQSLGIHVTNGNASTCVHSRLMQLYKTLFGTSRTLALCNLLAAERKSLPVAEAQAFGKYVEKVRKESEEEKETKGGGEVKEEETAQVDTSSSEKVATVTNGGSEKNDVEKKAEKESPGESEAQGKTKDGTIVPAAQRGKSEESMKKEPSDETNGRENQESKTDTAGAVTSEHSETSQTKEAEMKDPPPVVHVMPSKDSHISVSSSGETGQKEVGTSTASTATPTASPSTPTPLQTSSGQQSVWQKLSNKIKSLERNVTLSSGYLEELSVRYKKQIEDLQLSVRQTSESLASLTADRDEDRKEIKALRENITSLSGTVTSLTTQLETAGIWVSNNCSFKLALCLIVFSSPGHRFSSSFPSHRDRGRIHISLFVLLSHQESSPRPRPRLQRARAEDHHCLYLAIKAGSVHTDQG